MATVKFLNAAGKYGDPGARAAVIAYITQKEKTPHGYVGSAAVDLTCAAQQMQAVAESFKKDNKVRIRHFVVSFYPGEIKGPGQANFVALMLSSELAQRYQCVYAVHEDTDHVHFHIVFNPVSYVDGHKYSGTKEEHKDLRNLIGKYVRAMGIQIFYEVKYYPEPNNLYE
jgi:hypothetical protein